MKMYGIVLLGLIILGSCMQQTIQDEGSMKKDEISINHATQSNELLRHVVLFKFKETASNSEIQEIESAFATLPSKINVIQDFEWGLNNSHENLDKGFTHCFFVSFVSEKDRAMYLPHPDHLAFVELLKPALDDVLVIDYWTGDK